MNPLKVGVIGVGHLGKHHARIYSDVQEATLVAVSDINESHGISIADQYQVRFCPQLTDLLPLVDAVSVAVPTSDHFSIVQACLEAGVHVLVEKPITSTVQDAQQLVDLADQRNCMLQVGHVERFNPIIDLIRPFIQNPGFLECHRLSPFQARGTDVDVVLDLMIHDIDLVLSFGLGSIQSIEASGLAVLTKQIDIANARIVFENGGVATFTASRVSTGRLRKCRVFQQDAYLSIDYQARQAVMHRRIPGQKDDTEVETKELWGTDEEPLRRELLSFLMSVKDKMHSGVSDREGVAALKLAHQILDKIQTYTKQVHQRIPS